MKPSSRKYAEWEQMVGRINKGMTKAEVEKTLGASSRVISPGEIEILSYRDEQIGDAFYGIRVAFTNGSVSQCYLGFELCDPKPGTPPTSHAKRYFQLFLIVLLGAIVILLYGWLSAR